MTKPQINHLSHLMHRLVAVQGNKSMSSISKATLTAVNYLTKPAELHLNLVAVPMDKLLPIAPYHFHL